MLLIVRNDLPLGPSKGNKRAIRRTFGAYVSFVIGYGRRRCDKRDGLACFARLFIVVLFRFVATTANVTTVTNVVGTLNRGAAGAVKGF